MRMAGVICTSKVFPQITPSSVSKECWNISQYRLCGLSCGGFQELEKTPEKTEKHFYLLVSAHIKAVLKLHNIYSVYGTLAPCPLLSKKWKLFLPYNYHKHISSLCFFFLESDSRTASYLGQLAAPCIDLSLFVLHCCPFQTSQMAQKRNPVRKRCCSVRVEFNPTSADLVAHSVLRRQTLCLGGSRC